MRKSNDSSELAQAKYMCQFLGGWRAWVSMHPSLSAEVVVARYPAVLSFQHFVDVENFAERDSVLIFGIPVVSVEG